jgi:hypothetical protein
VDVHLHIERLVLDGIGATPAERVLLAETARLELTRLIATGGVSDSVAAGFSVPTLKGGAMTAASPINPIAFGRDLALTLYRNIGGGPP